MKVGCLSDKKIFKLQRLRSFHVCAENVLEGLQCVGLIILQNIKRGFLLTLNKKQTLNKNQNQKNLINNAAYNTGICY